ncbi:unnamed protein product [Effrenium voratum]|nr:unnamed protein product [Effrenium voratum]
MRSSILGKHGQVIYDMIPALLHGLCSLQLGAFGGSSLRLPPRWAALLACLFAIHPVHTESICYVVGRADIICAQVLLLAMQFYGRVLSGGSWAWLRLLCCTALVVLAGLCKETGFTFFGLLVIWEVLKMRGGLHAWLRVLGLLVIGAAACAVRVWYTAGTQIARMDPYSNPIAASDDPYTRVLSYALVHGMYMKLLLWPLFLCYDYSMDAVPLVQSAADVRLLLPCAEETRLLPTALGASVGTDFLLRCLGPLVGWLGFDFLDHWWPERKLSAEEWARHHAQKRHARQVAAVARALRGGPGGPVDREELRQAAQGFAESKASLRCAELKAMFYFAGCSQQGAEFLTVLRQRYGNSLECSDNFEDSDSDFAIPMECLLDTFALWPSHCGDAAHHQDLRDEVRVQIMDEP